METQGLNLFIVDDNKLMVNDLKHYLQNKFGQGVRVSTFNDGQSCLEMVDKKTDIVILDYFLEDESGLDVLKSIKSKNPKTEVIMLSSNEDMALAIQTFREGASEYVVKGKGAWSKVAKMVTHIVTKPIRMMVKEFGVSKFMATFLFTFVVMGIVVYTVLQLIK
ncbi:MAG TPA: response regulator [Bacteroidia bacterium]|jgi:DNA-binding NtrC family response regulator